MRYLTYENGYENYNEKEIKEVYEKEIDKGIYPSYESWIDDMVRSGVYAIYNEKDILNTILNVVPEDKLKEILDSCKLLGIINEWNDAALDDLTYESKKKTR